MEREREGVKQGGWWIGGWVLQVALCNYYLLHTEVIMLVHKIVKFSKEIPFLELLSGQDKNLLNKK